MLKFLKWFVVSAAVVILTACGGGGSGGDSNNIGETIPPSGGTVNPIDDNITVVQLDLTNLNITDLSQYYISNSNGKITIDINNGNKFPLNKDEKGVVALVDNFGTPYLMGRKISGESEVELSLATTAEMLVLSTAKFFGTNINNKQELSKRIRSHQSFDSLKTEIKFAIESNSSCPLSFSCNRFAADYAVEIANDTKIEDL